MRRSQVFQRKGKADCHFLCRGRWFFWRRNHLRREQLSQQEQPEHKQGTVPDFLPHLLATLHLISSFSPKTQKVLSPLSAGSLNNDNFKRLQKALKKLESHPGCTAGLCRHSMWSQSENLVVFLFGFCLRDELQLPTHTHTHTHTHTIKTTPAHVWPEAKRQHELLQPCWPWSSSLCQALLWAEGRGYSDCRITHPLLLRYQFITCSFIGFIVLAQEI